MILCIKNLTTKFGNKIVHNNLSIDFPKNKITLIMGGSGTGKSTLVDFIINAEDRECFNGELYWDGELWDRHDIAYKVGYAPQLGGFLLDRTVAENIAMPAQYVTGIDDKTAFEISWAYMQLVGLGPEVFSLYPNMLSGGMLRRASIARALTLEQQLIILDEPMSGLDPINCNLLMDLIKKIADTKTVIIVTHHFIHADYYVLFHGGNVVQGTLDAVNKSETGREFIQSFKESL